MRKIIVAGIGTHVGKTVVSAVLMKLLDADYWKPISCGEAEGKDSREVERLVNDPSTYCFPESYHFNEPLSPHQAARMEGVIPNPEKVVLPQTERPLIIESVGGVMCPFNETLTTLDLFVQWDCEWIVVSKNYLGSINHTLLTLQVLKSRGIFPFGIVFNGTENADSERFITSYSGLPIVGRIWEEEEINIEVIRRYCLSWKELQPWNLAMI